MKFVSCGTCNYIYIYIWVLLSNCSLNDVISSLKKEKEKIFAFVSNLKVRWRQTYAPKQSFFCLFLKHVHWVGMQLYMHPPHHLLCKFDSKKRIHIISYINMIMISFILLHLMYHSVHLWNHSLFVQAPFHTHAFPIAHTSCTHPHSHNRISDMFQLSLPILFLSFIISFRRTAATCEHVQCGGQNFVGFTSCCSGFECLYVHTWVAPECMLWLVLQMPFFEISKFAQQ